MRGSRSADSPTATPGSLDSHQRNDAVAVTTGEQKLEATRRLRGEGAYMNLP
jgi:hypothetical protein